MGCGKGVWGWEFVARGHMWPKIGMVGDGGVVVYTVACG
jgi:hypothetical protein